MKMGVIPPDLLERLAPLASMEDISVANTPLVTPLGTPLTTPAPSPRTRHRWSHRSSLGTILDEEEDDDSSEVDDFEMKDESFTLDELEQMNDSNETLDEDFKFFSPVLHFYSLLKR
ncbi:uncharacterized protein LOC111709244 [Eurytemora carolleeae]|uniref:uncharacterized protein LOC111709244 n=1 Tax=Eurytemora carolleeae TaxID=1294199 RepID=UPI000C78C9AC|nr:uncharacterized protein LOC111709244 [Eurytemora carolleeae]|eukprot:XP_023338639.1 uncharacterized protein LOC111709244 [Eurytemora affinis]